MSKEAARVIKQVEVNQLPNIVNKVNVDNPEVFVSCFNKIREGIPDTVVMIVAEIPITKKQKAKTMCVGAYIPEKFLEVIPDWLDQSIKTVINDGQVLEHIEEPNAKVVSIIYPEESESFPFKLIDVVNGSAFSILKKTGLQQEDEESSEEFYEF